MKKTTPKKMNWRIELESNTVPCSCCGRYEHKFPSLICNARTVEHGNPLMPEFQLVLDYPPEHICRILNDLKKRQHSGTVFHDGDVVAGIFEDCDVRLLRVQEKGKTFLRVIVPDKYNRFPEDKDCEYPYCMQTESLEKLCQITADIKNN